jgi:hypothetical protein
MIRSSIVVVLALFTLSACAESPEAGGPAADSERRLEAPRGQPDLVPASGQRSPASASDYSAHDAAAARDLIRAFRADRNNKIDDLYLEYGKGEWRQLGERVVEHTVNKTSKTLTQNASKPEKVLVDEMLGLVDEAADNALADMERDVFSTYVIEVGQGKRASALDDHTRGFFSNPDIQARCRDIASMGDKISELEGLVMKERVFSRP